MQQPKQFTPVHPQTWQGEQLSQELQPLLLHPQLSQPQLLHPQLSQLSQLSQPQVLQVLQPQLSQLQVLQLSQPQVLQPQLSQLQVLQLSQPQVLQLLQQQLLQFPQELQAQLLQPLMVEGAAGQGPVKKGKLRGRHNAFSAPTHVVVRAFSQPEQLRQELQFAKRMTPFLGIRCIL